MHIDRNVTIKKDTKVCEDHFRETDITKICYRIDGMKHRRSSLKKGAIPIDNSLLSAIFSEDSIRLLLDQETNQPNNDEVYILPFFIYRDYVGVLSLRMFHKQKKIITHDIIS